MYCFKKRENVMTPYFYLVVALISADKFFTPPTVMPSGAPYFNEIVQSDPMVIESEDIAIANIVSQNNFVVAIPIYDKDFKEKLDENLLLLADSIGQEDKESDEDFATEGSVDNYATTEDEDFCMSDNQYYVNKDIESMDTTLTTDADHLVVEE
jgi:hypothetical protein